MRGTFARLSHASFVREFRASTEDRMTEPKAALGLFSRRERWGLSRRGVLTVFTVCVLGTGGASSFLLPFLAVTSKTPARILVMEGWLHPDVVEVAAREFRTGG